MVDEINIHSDWSASPIKGDKPRTCPLCGRELGPLDYHVCEHCRAANKSQPVKTPINSKNCECCGKPLSSNEFRVCKNCLETVTDVKNCYPQHMPNLSLKDMKISEPTVSSWELKLQAQIKMFGFFIEDFFEKFSRVNQYVPDNENVCRSCFIQEVKDLQEGIMEKDWHSKHCENCFMNYGKTLGNDQATNDFAEKGIVDQKYFKGCPIIFGPHLKRLYENSNDRTREDAIGFYKDVLELVRQVKRLTKDYNEFEDLANKMINAGIDKKEVMKIYYKILDIAIEIKKFKSQLKAMIDIAKQLLKENVGREEELSVLNVAVKHASSIEDLEDFADIIDVVNREMAQISLPSLGLNNNIL